MTIIPTGRLAAALRRYGRAARLEPTPPVEIRLLVSDLAPLKHGDLPADGIRAEALALLPAEAASPREGDAITAGGPAGSCAAPCRSRPAPASLAARFSS